MENTVESRRDGIARWKYDASPRSSPRLSLTRQGLVRYLAFVVCKLTAERRENMKGDTNVSRWCSSHTRGKGATNEKEKFFCVSISASSMLFFFFFLRYERVNETLLLSKCVIRSSAREWMVHDRKVAFPFFDSRYGKGVPAKKYIHKSTSSTILFLFFFFINLGIYDQNVFIFRKGFIFFWTWQFFNLANLWKLSIKILIGNTEWLKLCFLSISIFYFGLSFFFFFVYQLLNTHSFKNTKFLYKAILFFTCLSMETIWNYLHIAILIFLK